MNINNLSFIQNNRMSVLQFSTEGKNSFAYISGNKAIESGKVKILEVSEAGSVNNIFVENLLDDYVFFSDGDILVGAKQNRVVNISMLLKPRSKTNVTVSCVEGGRWNRRTHAFSMSDYIVPRSIRTRKSVDIYENLNKTGEIYADQQKVWDEVTRFFSSMSVSGGGTSDLNTGISQLKPTYDEYVNNFKLHKEANGMAIFIDDEIVGIDIFNRDDIFAEYFPKLIKSSASDTYHLKEKHFELNSDLALQKTIQLLSLADDQNYVTQESPGVGILKVFSDNKISGFNLTYENHLIHMAVLKLSNNE